MKYDLYIQDPSDPNTKYLYEAMIEQVVSGTLQSWRGIYAFATGNGVKNLFADDPDVKEFAGNGHVSLVIGVDAITDPSALERLSALEQEYGDFEARVLTSHDADLFHPKLSHFQHRDGRSVLIVGSGNLTPGGLRRNIEAYSVVEGTNEELESIAAWDEFLERHAEALSEIDDSTLDRARRNQEAARRARQRGHEAEPEAVAEEQEAQPEGVVGLRDASRVLVGQVPGGGIRWHQGHYNADVVRQFFRAQPDSAERVSMTWVADNGDVGAEEIRKIVYSQTNRNMKIEIGARRDEDYPAAGAPIIVVAELGAKIFRYMLLMPGENGYDEMSQVLQSHPSIGRGLRRTIIDYRELKQQWPGCPM